MAAPEAKAVRIFDKKVYLKSAIDAAIEAYDGLASMDVERAGDSWTVSFEGVDDRFEPEMLASEFANYVLVGTIERKR